MTGGNAAHHGGLSGRTECGTRALRALGLDQSPDHGSALDQQAVHLRVDSVDAAAQGGEVVRLVLTGIGHGSRRIVRNRRVESAGRCLLIGRDS